MTKARDLSKLLSTANGKIAGANLDVSFENITDTGTEGTRVATGTNAQRGTTQGQLRFNTDTGLAEYYDGTSFRTIDSPPTISSISPTTETDANANIVITGSNFSSGATVLFIGDDGTEYSSPSVTVNSATQITATTPASALTVANEPYDVKVTNVSGLAGTLADALDAGGTPTWNTASGTLATINDNATGTHATVSATDPDGQTITYSETTSVLSGQNLTLNSSTGAISGDPTDVSSSTTHTFTLRASDGVNNNDRSFNIIVNPTLDGSTSAKANTSAQAIHDLTGTTTDGLYWIKDSLGNTQQMYCNMSATNGKWILVASNNWSSSTLPSGNSGNSTSYQINRNGTLGALGTADPNNDYLAGAIVDNMTFQYARILGWGRGSTNGTYSFTNKGNWDEAVWQLSTNTGTGRFIEWTSTANVTFTNNEFAHEDTSMYAILDTVRWCQTYGISPNANQFTIGGGGHFWGNSPSTPSGATYSGSWLGHGSTEGNGEGWYIYGGLNSASGNADAQGYTTWVK